MLSSVCTALQRIGERSLGHNYWDEPEKGSAERALGLQFLRERHLEQHVSEHCQKYLHRGAPRNCQSIQIYNAEEAAHHDRALTAVQTIEMVTKTLLADSLQGFLLLELSSLSDSEQVQVYNRAERRYRHTDTARALRDTWGEDSRLQTHDQHVAMEMKARRLARAVHTETVHSFFDSDQQEWCDDYLAWR